MSSSQDFFDEETIQRVEELYSREQAWRIRQGRIDVLQLAPGERVIDIGCGPGFYACEIGERVGPDGEVLGIDINEPMLGLATQRAANQPHVQFEIADAAELPAPDASFDAAISSQVFEYVEDVDLALREMHRVLRPGGRALIGATDWTSISWNSSDDARMLRMLRVFAEHCAHQDLPRTLAPRLRRAGFQVDRIEIQPIFESSWDADNYSVQIAGLIAGFAPGRDGVTEAEAEAWAEDLRLVGERDEHFFSINRFQFSLSKPART